MGLDTEDQGILQKTYTSARDMFRENIGKHIGAAGQDPAVQAVTAVGMIRRFAPFALRRGNWIQVGPARKSMNAASKHYDEWKVPGMKTRIKEIRPDDPGGGWQRNRREVMEKIEKGLLK